MGRKGTSFESKMSEILVYAVLFDHLYDIVNATMNRYEVLIFAALIVFLFYYQFDVVS